jgi:glycine betaine/choline ABC-type transport system substrate-binding protein
MGLLLLWAATLAVAAAPAVACVGKDLSIGVVASPQEIIYAELIAQMVTERTGTTVDVHVYPDNKELYAAVRKGEVGIIIENTARGMQELALPPGDSALGTYNELKKAYRERLNLVWLQPVAADGGNLYYAPVLLEETMGNLPALPKLINRLTGVLTEDNYAKLARAVSGAGQPRDVARNFLRAQKLI